MHRAKWSHGLWLIRARLALLSASLAALVVAGVSLTAAAGPENLGSIAVSDANGAASTVAEPDAAGPGAPAVSRGDVGRANSAVGKTTAGDRSHDQSAPVRLRVAAVELDVPLDANGVRSDGLMEIPDDGDRAGWYRYGAAPGEGSGSVVLAGHVDTDEGLGAMAALREVPLDAVVKVELEDGSVHAYEVVGRETIVKDDLPTDDIFDRSGPERLALITCGGPWRSAESGYRDNIIVVATPVDQH